jgi:hypothetical protein
MNRVQLELQGIDRMQPSTASIYPGEADKHRGCLPRRLVSLVLLPVGLLAAVHRKRAHSPQNFRPPYHGVKGRIRIYYNANITPREAAHRSTLLEDSFHMQTRCSFSLWTAYKQACASSAYRVPPIVQCSHTCTRAQVSYASVWGDL